MSKRFKPVKKTFSEIFDTWSKIKSLNYREKVKAYKTITFDIKVCYGKGIYTVEELNFFVQVLATTKMAASLQNKILAEWLELTGYSEAKIVIKKSGKISVESGTIAIFDEANSQKINNTINDDYSENNLLSVMNIGDIYMFNTGGDGIFDAQVRVVDGLEPMLSVKELKCVTSIGQAYFLHIPSGRLVIDDLRALKFGSSGIAQTVELGYYKIKVFHFHIFNKISSYYVVLCKVETPEQNNLKNMDNLEE